MKFGRHGGLKNLCRMACGFESRSFRFFRFLGVLMFPCCNMCYEKYLNKDFTLNLDALITIIEEETLTTFNKDREELRKDAEEKICRCRCHIIGSIVIH